MFYVLAEFLDFSIRLSVPPTVSASQSVSRSGSICAFFFNELLPSVCAAAELVNCAAARLCCKKIML